MTRASIIIVSHNNQEDLSACLPTLLPGLSIQDEVIIVDNASTDNCETWLSQNFPVVVFIQSQENLGYGGGNNLGARHAKGKYLVFLNPDTRVHKDWLDELIVALENNPEVGLVTSKILLASEPEKINTCGNEVHISGITLTRGLNLPSQDFLHPEKVSAISGAAFAIHREKFSTLGGFDEDFFMYMEDTDLSWRAQLSGVNCLFVPTSVVEHKYQLRFGPRKVFFQERNRYIMLLKTYRWTTLLFLVPTLLLSEIITWSFVLLKDLNNIRNKIDAYKWVIKNWALVLHKRTQAQSQRKRSDRQLLKQTTYHLEFFQTGKDFATGFATVILNPVFWVLRILTLAVVWW